MSNKQTTLFEGDVFITTSLDPSIYGDGKLNISGDLVVDGTATIGSIITPHSGLTGLLNDDHTQYTLLAGRSGGQILTAGTASGNNLVLRSTTNATKGSIVLDETTVSTSSITGTLKLAGGIGISNTTDAISSINGGTFTSAGGLAVAKKGYFGGILTAEAGLTSTAGTTTLGATNVSGVITSSNTTDAISSINGGSFTTAGGLAVAKKLYVGTNLDVTGTTNLGNYLEITSISTPGNSNAGNLRFYTDTADSLLKSKNSSGTVTTYQPTTTKGDLLVHNGTTQVRLPVGVNKRMLKTDSTVPNGVIWDYIPNNFDAIVDYTGNGNFLNIKSAFDAGCKTVFVRKGTYVETGNIVLPEGFYLNGESPGLVVISFAGNSYGFKIDGSGRYINTGTISITNNTSVVSGTGTTFTSLNTGDYINIQGTYYKITSVTNNTSLIIENPYKGQTVTNSTFNAQSMFVGGIMNNLIITGSTNSAINITQAFHITISEVIVNDCGTLNLYPNIKLTKSSECVFKSVINEYSKDDGFHINDCGVLTFFTVPVRNTAGYGIHIVNSNTINITCCYLYNNTDDGILVDDNSIDTVITECHISNNNGVGIRSHPSTQKTIITSCIIDKNAEIGIQSEGDENIINGNTVSYNKLGGINGGSKTLIINNRIEYNTGDGILGTNNDHTVYSNNSISNNTGIGAILSSSSVFTNNIVYNNTGDGILLNSNILTCLISNNHIHMNDKGINILSNANNNIITSNMIKTNSVNLSNNGSGNIIGGNKML